MKGQKLSMRCIRKILEYRLGKGISADQTCLALKVSKGSVINLLKRFKSSNLNWPLSDDISDTALNELLYPKPVPRKTLPEDLPNIKHMSKELSRPHMTLQRLWEEYHTDHPQGLKRSAFYRFYTKHKDPEVTMKMHHKGGDKLFVDYSGDGLEYVEKESGEVISVELFVCSWGASSYCYAEATRSQSQEDFAASHKRAFQYFDRVPFAIVPDNLKSAIVKADRLNPLVNRVFSYLCDHYGTVPLPARVRKPRDKATVESNVLHIQRFILARLRNRQFFSLSEINTAIHEELELFNKRPMKDHGNQTRKQRFESLDKPYAKPLPATSFKIVSVKDNVKVARDYHISYKKHFYSVPWKYAGKRVEIRQSDHLIEIYYDHMLISRHQFSFRKYGYTTRTEHMPQRHQYVKGWSPGYFLDQAKKIGPQTTAVIEATFNRTSHVEQGYKAAMGILQLAKQFTAKRLEKACERALFFKNIRCNALKNILINQLDKLPPVIENKSTPIIEHENIRGSINYQ